MYFLSHCVRPSLTPWHHENEYNDDADDVDDDDDDDDNNNNNFVLLNLNQIPINHIYFCCSMFRSH